MRPLPTRSREKVESWDGVAVTPRDAATVVLLRPGADALQVFLMRRQSTMNFAAGMHVFPGGSVEATDADPAIGWVGSPPAWWAEKFGCTNELGRALVVAAVRETFEETGILLAGPADGAPATDAVRYSAARTELEKGRLNFAQFLADNDLSVRADLLGPWAHWVTPEFEPRRFDTRFFIALLPEGQHVRNLASEADHGIWLDLREARRAGKAGELAMMHPTLHTMRQLIEVTGNDPLAVTADREVTTVAPKLVRVDGEYWLDNPGIDEI